MPAAVAVPDTVRWAVVRITDLWNAVMPRNRVRVRTRQRTVDVASVLREMTEEQVIQAVRFYSKSEWNRTRQVWRTFDHFMTIEVCTYWYEKACEHADLADAARRRQAQAGKAGASPAITPPVRADCLRAGLVKRFADLPADRQEYYLVLARAKLAAAGAVSVTGQRGGGDFCVRGLAVDLFAAEAATP